MTPNDGLHRDTDPDAVDLTWALRDCSGLVPEDRVDWRTFHARLAMRAELSLARLRHPGVVVASGQGRTLPLRRQPAPPVTRPWWQHAAHWSRMVVDSAVAAGAALVGVIRLTPKEMASHAGDVVSGVRSTSRRSRSWSPIPSCATSSRR